MLHGNPQQMFQKVLQRSIVCSISPLLVFAFCFCFNFVLLWQMQQSSGCSASTGMNPSEAQAAPSRPRLLPLRLLIGWESGGTSESSLPPFEPWKWGESETNYIFKQEFKELNVYFWRGRIRAAAGDKTCPSYWACSASLRSPQKFQNIHLFSKVLVGTTRGRVKRKGDFQEL